MQTKRLYTRGGMPVTLGPRIAEGGEGSVFRVPDSNPSSPVIAKIYHEKPGKGKREKLNVMTDRRVGELRDYVAWPQETISDENGDIVGFLMEEMTNAKPVHLLYSPLSAVTHFKDAGAPFLLHVAQNICRAFASLHEAEVVIGDVNPNNVLVRPDGTVALIDADSFQVRKGKKLFTCTVGDQLFLAPELFSVLSDANEIKTLGQIPRSDQHDAFALAVVLFHVLFLGRHPFAGVWRGAGDPPETRENAQEGRFAFSRGSDVLVPPPSALKLTTYGSQLADLFEQAFQKPNDDIERPSAQDWLRALETSLGELSRCRNDTNHLKVPRVQCQFCRLEKLGFAALPASKKISESPEAKKAKAAASQSQASKKTKSASTKSQPAVAQTNQSAPYWLWGSVAMVILIALSLMNSAGGDTRSGTSARPTPPARSTTPARSTPPARSTTPARSTPPARSTTPARSTATPADGVWRNQTVEVEGGEQNQAIVNNLRWTLGVAQGQGGPIMGITGGNPGKRGSLSFDGEAFAIWELSASYDPDNWNMIEFVPALSQTRQARLVENLRRGSQVELTNPSGNRIVSFSLSGSARALCGRVFQCTESSRSPAPQRTGTLTLVYTGAGFATATLRGPKNEDNIELPWTSEGLPPGTYTITVTPSQGNAVSEQIEVRGGQSVRRSFPPGGAQRAASRSSSGSTTDRTQTTTSSNANTNPILAGLTIEQQTLVSNSCADVVYRGPNSLSLDGCLRENVDRLKELGAEPSLAGLTSSQRTSVTGSCLSQRARQNNGVLSRKSYYVCLEANIRRIRGG